MKTREKNLKSILIGVFFMLLLTLPSLLMAQKGPIDKLFKKYSGEKGFTIVNISSEMFQFFGQMNAENSEEGEEFSNIVNNLTGLKILTLSNDIDSKFYNEILKIVPVSEYMEIMTVKDEDSNVKFLAKKNGKNFSELIMIAKENNETTLLYFTGDIDLKNISNLSKGMHIKGMEKLDSLDNKNND